MNYSERRRPPDLYQIPIMRDDGSVGWARIFANDYEQAKTLASREGYELLSPDKERQVIETARAAQSIRLAAWWTGYAAFDVRQAECSDFPVSKRIGHAEDAIRRGEMAEVFLKDFQLDVDQEAYELLSRAQTAMGRARELLPQLRGQL